MRKTVETIGFILVLMGVSGAVDRLWTQPIMSLFLNAFDRWVIPHLPFATGYEVYANLMLAVVGGVIILLGGRLKA
ncbi:hypothetical protein [Phytomonospora endophytica]|uniref:Uncharacterized protein n=1 Tax=Phytomonospora endophytica TaxID=714109 RepID=A0A841FN29_9ACTN|nr:hypothetical protein [Phytomonospora endophytica]MBB6034009.1 hypothetical protein [Phytomonospora endophytica]GIG64470.1 hypothetical protein Pen01_07650 [Phytomonospora endophytica]